MREIIGILLLIFLIAGSIAMVSANTESHSNITFGDRHRVGNGWGHVESNITGQLASNNGHLIVAGGPNYDYEVRIVSYNNRPWQIVATGNIPNEGIEFTLYLQYIANQGAGHIYNTRIIVNGPYTVDILNGIGGTGSIDQVRVSESIISTTPPIDNDTTPPTDNDNTNQDEDTGTDKEPENNTTPPTDNDNTNQDKDVGTDSEVKNDNPVVEDSNEINNNAEEEEKYLALPPRPPQNNVDSNESNVLGQNNVERDEVEYVDALAEMQETGLPFGIIAILVILSLFAIKRKRQ